MYIVEPCKLKTCWNKDHQISTTCKKGSSPLLIRPSLLQSSNPFRNDSATNEGGETGFLPNTCTQMSNVISGVTGSKFTKFVLILKMSYPLSTRAFNHRYSNWLWNSSAKNDGGINQCSFLAPKIYWKP